MTAMVGKSEAAELCEQAVNILRSTSDGDALDPSDLALLQYVVNASTLADFTEEGRARWAYLREATASGTYQQRWFHGVEHLRCSHEGYVSWRGKTVEHYTRGFPGERESARYLGACCLRLEKDGIAVTSQNLFSLYDRMRRAAELGPDAERYAAVWTVAGTAMDLRVHVVEAADDAGIASEMSQVARDLGVTGRGDKTCQPLITKEDFDAIVAAMTQAAQWNRRQAFMRPSEQSAWQNEPEASIARLHALVKRDSLLDKAAVEEAYVGYVREDVPSEPQIESEGHT